MTSHYEKDGVDTGTGGKTPNRKENYRMQGAEWNRHATERNRADGADVCMTRNGT